jgi:hypothetical protein
MAIPESFVDIGDTGDEDDEPSVSVVGNRSVLAHLTA